MVETTLQTKVARKLGFIIGNKLPSNPQIQDNLAFILGSAVAKENSTRSKYVLLKNHSPGSNYFTSELMQLYVDLLKCLLNNLQTVPLAAVWVICLLSVVTPDVSPFPGPLILMAYPVNL